MMKKRRLSVFVIVLIVIMGIASIQSTQAHERRVGERLGDVLNTDIRVFINDVQIMGYNIGGHTYVVVEDLRAYGFVVVWDGITRALHISKGASSEQARIIPDNLQPVGSVAFPFLYSDIVTYIGSERI
ncbi:MAG: hypothetical protein FWB71_03825, partial [Defluviitaleaceae bacterium]|nr:hypothetical protein [Defluviitaleaceae bacterium]